MKKLIAGHWKMNLDRDGANQLVFDLLTDLPSEDDIAADYLVCPPYLYLDRCTKFFAETQVAIGAQDCAAHENGAHTGDISAQMLREMGCTYVILGHSERRHGLGESSALVKAKAAMAHRYDLIPIICVGETEEERDGGQEYDVVERQLAGSLPDSAGAQKIVIAYEPVWAIGTGKTATPDDVAAMHGFIRKKLAGHLENAAEIRILYGGSVKPDNAAELFRTDNVDGALIGGASLKAESFLGIAEHAGG